MLRPRVIPILLLKGGGVYKTSSFKDPSYVGDPINTVRIFNEKQVDELCILDIGRRYGQVTPQFTRIKEIVSEAFMPIAYGGCIDELEQAKIILKCGVEKIVLNTLIFNNPVEVKSIIKYAGSSSVVFSIDYMKSWFGRSVVMTEGGTRPVNLSIIQAARLAEEMGAGEILLNSIDREGARTGYDTTLIQQISHSVSIPVVACGGGGTLAHLNNVLSVGASAAAAGTMFIYHGPYKAVLISYPLPSEIESLI